MGTATILPPYTTTTTTTTTTTIATTIVTTIATTIGTINITIATTTVEFLRGDARVTTLDVFARYCMLCFYCCPELGLAQGSTPDVLYLEIGGGGW